MHRRSDLSPGVSCRARREKSPCPAAIFAARRAAHQSSLAVPSPQPRDRGRASRTPRPGPGGIPPLPSQSGRARPPAVFSGLRLRRQTRGSGARSQNRRSREAAGKKRRDSVARKNRARRGNARPCGAKAEGGFARKSKRKNAAQTVRRVERKAAPAAAPSQERSAGGLRPPAAPRTRRATCKSQRGAPRAFEEHTADRDGSGPGWAGARCRREETPPTLSTFRSWLSVRIYI